MSKSICKGKIASFNYKKGEGSIKRDENGDELWFDRSEVLDLNESGLRPNQSVEFKLGVDPFGRIYASNIKRCEPWLQLFYGTIEFYSEMGKIGRIKVKDSDQRVEFDTNYKNTIGYVRLSAGNRVEFEIYSTRNKQNQVVYKAYNLKQVNATMSGVIVNKLSNSGFIKADNSSIKEDIIFYYDAAKNWSTLSIGDKVEFEVIWYQDKYFHCNRAKAISVKKKGSAKRNLGTITFIDLEDKDIEDGEVYGFILPNGEKRRKDNKNRIKFKLDNNKKGLKAGDKVEYIITTKSTRNGPKLFAVNIRRVAFGNVPKWALKDDELKLISGKKKVEKKIIKEKVSIKSGGTKWVNKNKKPKVSLESVFNDAERKNKKKKQKREKRVVELEKKEEKVVKDNKKGKRKNKRRKSKKKVSKVNEVNMEKKEEKAEIKVEIKEEKESGIANKEKVEVERKEDNKIVNKEEKVEIVLKKVEIVVNKGNEVEIKKEDNKVVNKEKEEVDGIANKEEKVVNSGNERRMVKELELLKDELSRIQERIRALEKMDDFETDSSIGVKDNLSSGSNESGNYGYNE